MSAMQNQLEIARDAPTGKRPIKVKKTLCKRVREALLSLGGEAHRSIVIEQVARNLGHDVRQILTALETAQKTRGRPTVIVAETVKGKGFSFAENNAAFHNGALTADQYRQALSELEARRAALG